MKEGVIHRWREEGEKGNRFGFPLVSDPRTLFVLSFPLFLSGGFIGWWLVNVEGRGGFSMF